MEQAHLSPDRDWRLKSGTSSTSDCLRVPWSVDEEHSVQDFVGTWPSRVAHASNRQLLGRCVQVLLCQDIAGGIAFRELEDEPGLITTEVREAVRAL